MESNRAICIRELFNRNRIMDTSQDTAEIDEFSLIRFGGIPKKTKPLLRAMKKTPPPAGSGSYFSMFKNPLRREEGQAPKKMILTDNKHRYNPVTKTYEFEGEEEVKTEEFKPPPKQFSRTHAIEKTSKYVDVLSEQNKTSESVITENTGKYRKVEEQSARDDFLESILSETSHVVDEVVEGMAESKTEQKKELEAALRKYKNKIKIQKDKIKGLIQVFEENLMIPEFQQYSPSPGPFVDVSIFELEKQNLQVNAMLKEKMLENLALNEKLIFIENQSLELARKVELHESERNGMFNNYHDENSRLSHELKITSDRYSKIEANLKDKIKTLEAIAHESQEREKIHCQARAKSEINEKNAILKQKQIERDYKWAVNIIHSLNQKVKQEQKKSFDYLFEITKFSVDTTDLEENLKLSSIYLTTKEQLSELLIENERLKLSVKELNEEVGSKDNFIIELEENNKIMSQKYREINKKEQEVELGKLNLKYQNERNAIAQELSEIQNKYQTLKQEITNYRNNEIEYKDTIEKFTAEIEFLKNENLDLLSNEQSWQENEIIQKSIIDKIHDENKNLIKELEKSSKVLSEMAKKSDDLKKINEKLEKENINFHQDHEKKLNDLVKKSQASESKLQHTISSLEDSNIDLEKRLKSSGRTIQDLELKINEMQESYIEEIKNNAKDHEEKIDKVNQENCMLHQELRIVRESTDADINSLHKKLEQKKFIIQRLEAEVTENAEITERNESLSAELNEKSLQIKELMLENGKQKNIITDCQANLSNLSAEKDSLNNKINDLSQKLSERMDEIRQTSTSIDLLNGKVRGHESLHSKLVEEKEELLIKIEGLEQELSLKHNECIDHEKQKNHLETKYNGLSHNIDELAERNAFLQVELDSEIAISADLSKKLQAFNTLEQDFSNLRQDNEDLSSKMQVLQNENERIYLDLEKSQEIINKLETQVSEPNSSFIELQGNYEDLQSEFNTLSEENIKMYEELNSSEVKLAQALGKLTSSEEQHSTEILTLNQNHEETLQSLHHKLSQLENELKYEKNEKNQILREFNATKMQKASVEKVSIDEKSSLQKSVEDSGRTIQNLTSTCIESAKTIDDLQSQITSLEAQITELTSLPALAPTNFSGPQSLSSQFDTTENALGFDFLPQNSAVVTDLQNENWELQAKVQTYEEEILELKSQIDSLNQEMDSVYDKNLTLMQKNKVILTEQKSIQEVHSNFATVAELEKRIKEKDEELLLAKQSFQELVQRIAEDPQNTHRSAPKAADDGWLSSVIGSIFLTDKERGVS